MRPFRNSEGTPGRCRRGMSHPRRPRLAAAVPVLAILGAFLAPARAARAELVVFEDGRVVKAARYEVRGDELEIGLPGGGSFSVEMARVERIVDDEVAPPAAVAEVTPPKTEPPLVYDLGYRHERKPLFGTPYDSIIAAEAKRYNVDAALVSALIRAESNFDPRAVSRKGARGLMQLMPATARRLDVRSPFDPVSNVRGGVRYLRAPRAVRQPSGARARGLQRGGERRRELRGGAAVSRDGRVREAHPLVVDAGGPPGVRTLGRADRVESLEPAAHQRISIVVAFTSSRRS